MAKRRKINDNVWLTTRLAYGGPLSMLAWFLAKMGLFHVYVETEVYDYETKKVVKFVPLYMR